MSVLLPLPDGSLVVGGAFTAMNNVPCRNVARLTPGGTVDARWTPQVDGPVNCLAAQDQHLFVAGAFQSVNGVARAGLAKVDLTDRGMVDGDWDPHPAGPSSGPGWVGRSPFAGHVSSMAVAHGHLFVGGSFQAIGGWARLGLAKLELTGTGRADAEWAPRVGTDALTTTVWALAVREDQLIVGGDFSSLGGQEREGLARIAVWGTGEVDLTWDPALRGRHGLEIVRALELDGDDLLVGGNTVSNGLVVGVSLLQTGSPQTSTFLPLERRLATLTVMGEGLFVSLEPGGNAPGGLVRRFSRVNPAGTAVGWQDPRFARPRYVSDVGAPGTSLAEVHALAGQGSILWVGGNFRRVNDTRALGLAGLDPVAGIPSVPSPPQVRRPGTVLALARQSDGKLIAGGEFASVDHVPRDNLARWRTDGTLDLGWFPAADGAVSTLAANTTGVYVGGTFREIGGARRPYLARFGPLGGDQADSAWTPPLTAPDEDETLVSNPIRSLAVHGSNVFVAGPLEILGTGFGGFAVVDAMTGRASPGPVLAQTPRPVVTAMALADDDYLILGGNLRTVAGVACPGLVRMKAFSPFTLDPTWVPSLDWATLGTPVALATSDSELFLATSRGAVCKVNSTGAGGTGPVWTAENRFCGPWEESVRSVAVAGPDVYVGGLFWPLDGLGMPNGAPELTLLVQLDRKTGAAKLAWNAGHSPGLWEQSFVHVLLGLGDDCAVGGHFEGLGGLPRIGLALLASPDAPVLLEGTGWSCTVTRNPEDGPEVTHFRVVGVTGGALFLKDGATAVDAGDFITVAQGKAGLIFVPETGTADAPSVSAVAALGDSNAGADDAVTTLLFRGGSQVPFFKFNQPSYQVRESETVRIAVEKIGAGAGSVGYGTRDGTALSGDDYLARSGILQFADWQTAAVLPPIHTGNDFVFRGDRTFTVHLSAPTGGGGLGEPASATVTVVDDDLLGSADSFLQSRWPEPLLPRTNAALEVILLPLGAGGQWRLSGEPAWRNSGDVALGLAPANHLVEFRSWPGFWPLNPRLVPVLEDQTNRLVAEYFARPDAGFGHLTVHLIPEAFGSPSDANTRGAWRMPGQTNWLEGGATVLDIPAGPYELEFKPVPGLLPPLDPRVTVFANQTAAATKTYLVAQEGRGTLPRVLSFDEVVSTNWPYLHNGQVASELAFGSGVVVKERVVLTAAHVLFDDKNLRYAQEVKWFHQKHRGACQPAPQIPRGWYVFEGYAKQREADASPGLQSIDAAKLDAAAMFFVGLPLETAAPGRGGYAGFLTSDAALQNQHLLSANPMILVGYPVAGVPPDQIGQMHATPPAQLNFSPLQDNLLTTEDVQAFPGMSGGTVFVQTQEGHFCPGGIYLGRGFEVIVRSIDIETADLILRAEYLAEDGGKDLENGVILIRPVAARATEGTGYLAVQIRPADAVERGAAWRIPEKGMLAYSCDSTRLVPLDASEPFRIEFREAAGYELPTNDVVEVAADQVSIIHAHYPVVPPVLRFAVGEGLTVSGTVGTSYRLEFAERLMEPTGWEVLETVTLTNGLGTIPQTALSNPVRGFYRAVWLPEP